MQKIMNLFLMALVSAVLMSAQTPVWAAKEKVKAPQEQSQEEEKMSDQGVENTNSPASGDQLKGKERADERKAFEHENEGKKPVEPVETEE